MALHLYNTLTRSLDPFIPRDPPRVTMYVCGPTVYDVPHIGHARSAYVFDVLRRYLTHNGFTVQFVRNVTDVDDKIIEKARHELARPGDGERRAGGAGDLKAKCKEVAERYLTSYHGALDRLGILRPDQEPRATDHVIPDPKNVEATRKIDASMTGFISQLLTKNMAYPAGGDVYFPVRKFAQYGRLSNRSLDDVKAGARIEPGEQKDDPLDFALWKAAKPDEPSWNSPWGHGRPGWHIECSVMSTVYLGDAFDIHGGGVDLVFPHHENEIAQAQAVGKPFARTWIHNGLLTVNGEKMSKAVGNYITVDQALEAYPHPDHLKIFFLKTHYRSPIDYSVGKMEEAKKNWQDFCAFFDRRDQLQPSATMDVVMGVKPNFRSPFTEAMDDDLNTPKAIAVLFDVLAFGHQGLEQGGDKGFDAATYAYREIIEFGMLLGLFTQGTSEESQDARDRVQKLIAERDSLRKAKNFTRSDEIRERLKSEGYHLMDTRHGTFWRRVR